MSDNRPSWWRTWLADPKKLIAYSLMLGAAFAIFALLSLGLTAPDDFFALRRVFVFALAFVLYVTAGWIGVSLLRNHPRAVGLAMLAQVPQVVQFQNSWMKYEILCGLYGNIYFTTSGDIDFDGGLQSQFALSIGNVGLPAGIGVNIVAVIVFLYLRRVRDTRLAMAESV